MDHLRALGPDVQGHLNNAPAHWLHKGVEIFSNMDAASGVKAPILMHGCWACMFGYAVSRTYCLGMGDRAVRYIEEGHSEEFERCARALCAQRGVQPTLVKVLREIIVNNWRDPVAEGIGVDRQGPLGEAPALFSAQVPGLPASFGVPPPQAPEDAG